MLESCAYLSHCPALTAFMLSASAIQGAATSDQTAAEDQVLPVQLPSNLPALAA